MSTDPRDLGPGTDDSDSSLGAHDATETLAGPASPSDRSSESPQALDRGELLGRYLVLDYLGGGGMGVVYTAYDPNLDRKVAVKLLRAEVMSHRTREARKRLVQEARALAKLAHPNVVAVHDIGAVRNQIFLAMEHVEGKDLRVWLKDESPSWEKVIDVFIQAGEGLVAAHRAGLLHRDFKPANVILGDDGRARVLDFGLAAQVRSAPITDSEDHGTTNEDTGLGTDDGGRRDGQESEASAEVSTLLGGSRDETTRMEGGSHRESLGSGPGSAPNPSTLPGTNDPPGQLTEPGSRVGTPAYMSPEQLRGLEIDARSDQYGFCVALYEALWRRSPFANRYARPLAGDLAEKIVPPPSESEVPASVTAAVLRGLEHDPAERFPDMESLLEALKPETPRPGRLALLLAAIALVLVIAAVRLLDTPPCQNMGKHWLGVWDEARKADVRKSFDSSSLPWASGLGDAIERQLDTYTADWTRMRTESCKATRVTGEQSENLLDRRTRCLDRRLYEVDAVAALLAQADDDIVRNAGRAMSTLRPLEHCADSEALLAAFPPPSPEIRQATEEAQKNIAEVSALFNLRQSQRISESSERLRQKTALLDYPPVEAEALEVLGLAEELQENRDASRKIHLRAIAKADAGHADDVRVRSLLALVWLDREDLPKARTWLELADGVVDRLDSSHLRGLWHQRDSELLRTEGDFAASLEAARRAVEEMRNPAGPDHPNIAFPLTTLADILFRLQKNREALEVATEVVEIQKRRFGEAHPDVAYAESVKAVILGQLDRHAEALEIFERIEGIYLDTYGPDHFLTAYLLQVLGSTRNRLGQTEGALEALERSAEARLRSEGPQSRLAADTYNSMALVYWQEGRLEEAEDRFRKAVEGYELSGAVDHPQTWIYRTNLARVVLDQNRPGPAARLLEPTWKAAREALGPDHLTTLHSALGLGTAWLRLGRVEEGGALIEEVAKRADAVGAQDWILGIIRFSQARLARARQDEESAQIFIREARTIFGRMGRAGAFDLGLMEAWAEETAP